MKRFLTIAFASCLFASSATAQFQYGWSVSRDAADPSVNTGPVAAGVASMYLWFFCTEGTDGMSAADITATFSAGNIPLAFVTANGYLNAGTTTSLLLAVGGCPAGPVNAGSWLVSKNAPLDICLGGLNVTVDCRPSPEAWANDFVGFSETGVPCTSGPLCEVITSVEDSSWGSIKGLYR